MPELSTKTKIISRLLTKLLEGATLSEAHTALQTEMVAEARSLGWPEELTNKLIAQVVTDVVLEAVTEVAQIMLDQEALATGSAR